MRIITTGHLNYEKHTMLTLTNIFLYINLRFAFPSTSIYVKLGAKVVQIEQNTK